MHDNPLALVLIAPIFISSALMLYAWHRRSVPGAHFLALLLTASTLYVFGYMLEVASSNLSAILFWTHIEYIGITTEPVFWLVLVLQFSGQQHWLTRRNLALLLVIPAITVLLNTTNSFHHLYYATVGLDTSGPFPLLAFTPGPWYWVNVVTIYIETFGGCVYLFSRLRHFSRLYRRQAIVILIGSLAPLTVGTLYLLKLNSWPHVDLIPFALTISGTAMAFGIFRYYMLNLAPIARDTLVENLEDGLFIVDNEFRIVDFNPAALKLFDISGENPIGRPVDEFLYNQPDVAAICRSPEGTMREFKVGGRYLSLQLVSLTNRKNPVIGHMLIARDITNMKRSAEELRSNLERVEKLNDLSRTLSNTLDLDGLLESAAIQAVGLANAEACLIFLNGDNGLAYKVGYPAYAINQLLPEDQDQQDSEKFKVFAYRSIQTGRSILLDLKWSLAGQDPSIILIPLVVGGKIHGVLVFVSRAQKTFTSTDLPILESAGRQIAAAVENARLFQEIQLIAQIDSLTGLYARRHFFSLAEHEFKYSGRYGNPLSLIMIDIDHFKVVNDTFGHAVGDKTLKEISRCIHNAVRGADIVGRYGGEEIVVLLPNTQISEASQMAERLRVQIATLRAQSLEITASFGVVQLDVQNDHSIEAVIQRADAALYVAKKAGRNQVACQP
jgi:diguanylate cyclase (GGDEF)-like protein/PAS domain S-box-containing protein